MVTERLPQFSDITESPLTRATADQFRILYTRYALAAKHATGKEVLEVACGAGVGLGMLAEVARSVAGGDIDARNVATAQATYRSARNIRVLSFDALRLPFADGSFDLVVLYEALYYLASLDAFLYEVKRVLRRGGTLIISTVNCRWSGFNPSPFSTRYYDAAELASLLTIHGFQTSLLGGFEERPNGPLRRTIGAVRKAAVRLHLIPKTQRGKEWLKRIFYGSLRQIPRQLKLVVDSSADLESLQPSSITIRHRFIYAIAVRR